jgi:hypothetical protein
MIRPHAILAAAVSLLCLPANAAGDPLSGLQFGLALRSGYTFNPQDNLNGYLLGLGFTVEHPLSDTLTLQGELGYYYKPGRQYNAAFLPAAAGRPQADPARSADLRKNQVEGLVLRLGAAWALTQEWSFQAGLQMGNSRFSQQVIGQTLDTHQTYSDTYNATPVKSAPSVSPFVGVGYTLDPNNVVELDVLALGYKAIDFRHTPGSPLLAGSTSTPGSTLIYQGDHLDERTRFAPTVEISYRFRF